MNRSIWFLMINTLVLGVVIISFFYYSRADPSKQQISPENSISQKHFLKESMVLDSLFKNYKISVAGDDEATLIDSELRLKNQLNDMKVNCNHGLLMNDIACKLITNYESRIQLVVTSSQLKDQSSDQTQILKKRIAEIQKSNEHFRLQNQMIQQAILNLP
jgi:hypothetical protein